jgi:hypothetical protein
MQRTFFEWSVDDQPELPSRAVLERAARHGWRDEPTLYPGDPLVGESHVFMASQAA